MRSINPNIPNRKRTKRKRSTTTRRKTVAKRTTRRRSPARKTTRRRRTYRRNPPIVKQITSGLTDAGWATAGRIGANVVARQLEGFLPAELTTSDAGRLASQVATALGTAMLAGAVAPKKAQPFIVAGAFQLPMETAIRAAAGAAGASFITDALSGMSSYPLAAYPTLEMIPAPGITTLEGMNESEYMYG